MSRKKNKKKKKPHQPQMGGYKKFLIDMQEALNFIRVDIKLQDIPGEYKRMMYDFRLRISNPVAANALISPKELKNIADKTKRYYRQSIHDSKGHSYSTYQLMLVQCYTSVRAKMYEKEFGDAHHPHVVEMKNIASRMFTTFYSNFILQYFRIITQLSNPCYKYYGINIRPAALYKKNPMFEIVVEAVGVPAPKYMMLIDGLKRPTYRLGKAHAEEGVEWIKVNKKSLGGYYQGEKEVLDVYIQSHAIKRMAQRLDLLGKGAINYLLWENTHTITQFQFYRGYILLPVLLYEVKVGYLMAKVVEDKVLFRTFLFITHNFSPEGDKLKEISGLGKHDISYWRIDRLSTFVNLDGEKYKELLDLFQQAGIKGLEHLKEKDFDIDQLQSVNLDGLMGYIKKGQEHEKFQKKEFNEFVVEGLR